MTDRAVADAIITDNLDVLHDGAFHVRQSAHRSTNDLPIYVLTVLQVGEGDGEDNGVLPLRRYQIVTSDAHRFGLDGCEMQFNDLTTLVDYYANTPSIESNLCTRLSFPASRLCLPVHAADHLWEIRRHHLQFVRHLGSGNFSDVKLALWRDNIEVAVKIMKNNTMTCHDFVTEGDMMRRCNHEHIVRLFGFCTDKEPLQLVTEFMSHGSLRDYLVLKGGKVGDKQMIVWSQHVASGMSYLEELNIVHRDLAARNVLLNTELRAKVADFGLARVLMDKEVYQAKFGTKLPVKWTAPEAARKSNFTIQSDVWSYGVLLYEVFTRGMLPYFDMTNQDVILKLEVGYRLPRPTQCPEKVYDMMLLCWAEEPADRPPFAELTKFFATYKPDVPTAKRVTVLRPTPMARTLQQFDV